MQDARPTPTDLRIHSTTSPVQPNPTAALRWLRITAVVLIVGAAIGITWDGIWHIQNPFEDFFSPPHLFVYTVATITGLMVMGMVFTPSMRTAFGRGFNVVILPFPVPGSLFILGAGFVMLGFAGLVLDNYWHSTFGLDETRWSFPHAMIGAALFVISLGFAASRMALSPHKPLRWHSRFLVAFLGIWLMGSWLGPIINNHTPDTVTATYSIPVLQQQPEAMHTFRIYQEWNLNRTNPALIVMGAMVLGMGLAFASRVDSRWWMLLLVVGLWQGTTDQNQASLNFLNQYVRLVDNEANWEGLPYFLPAALWLLLMRFKVSERAAYAAAGVLFGLLVWSIWQAQPPGLVLLLVLLAAPAAAIVGGWIGRRVYEIAAAPNSPRQTLALILSFGVAVPFVTGIIDLALRSATP
ncbi:MAG: hypothetical protein SF029_26205 [bacterium]|nr:hypothetical protein [bacterium]